MKRHSKNQLSYGIIGKWFEEVLDRSARRPTKEQYLKLADILKNLINRSDNRENRGAGKVPMQDLKDLELQQELRAKIDAVVTSAKVLQMFMGEVLPTPGGDVLLEDLRDMLRKILTLYAPGAGDKRGAGRPREVWHEPGLAFAEAVQILLRQLGYRRSLSLKNSNSAPVVIASRAMSWAYKTSIMATAVASAARGRKRRKPAHQSLSK